MNTFLLPNKGEYPAYYSTYIDLVPETPFCELVESQIEDLKSLFASKRENWSDHPYQSGKWSPKEVLGHVIDTERIMTFRALCFARGEKSALPGFDQDPYVLNARFGSVQADLLIKDFEAQRRALMTLVQTLREDVLDFRGEANGNTITPRALFWIIPGHFIHHLNILKERY
ncbi:MAG TPA: damage-inducible protein DinB [Algoriphagus sp.]|jgi:hypothetical protein|uniref:DinB family protein n=1 Tax=unclassified Algoriphagus TaxID=2641541 RepID=UPI000C4356CC|nr:MULTISPECIES: DinB family protein [unclassified Algoriphagus]MAL11913.1 damage-inducible protein DinB [Algoriphagus sp.]MAN86504.1 damage-inducible protein DinB [Algoriphagus sp.]HAD51197.1 damage-inducible protein DinB [Algoriphagus sp.]HAH35654.1 damage-inducible protein DinB [Algoriphagus sp.]HAS57741.1 damage-inducible protein DinB [Algoriphagus sp.]|tara:strand:+ start:3056 stop:3571 length:516 start_codon:yes stop_codon:yes gene_type:complete